MRPASLFAPALFLALFATGCQRQQLSRWSQETKYTVANDIAVSESGGSGLSPRERDYVMEELERYVADRQRRDLERENDRLRDELRNRGGGIFPVMGVTAFSSAGSSSYHRIDRRIDRRVARTYGISTDAARRLILLLGQAAVGDTSGLRALGIDERAMGEASRNGGRLSQEQLAYASRRLGVSPRRLDQLMQRFAAVR